MNTTNKKPENYDELVTLVVNTYVTTNLHAGVIGFQSLSQDQIESLCFTCEDIVRHRDKVQYCGSFAEAIVEGDLDKAIEHADILRLSALKLFFWVKKNIHIIDKIRP